MFAPSSRYASVPEAVYTDAAGVRHPYKLLRPIPPAGLAVRAHVVVEADRLDLLAAKYYGDPEQFWRICDGNGALWPDELLEIQRRLTIPTPLR